MTRNVGTIDRTIRIVAGVLLIAYALGIGFPATGWNFVGWLGVVPLATALLGWCPAYTLVGLNTCPASRRSA